jgi:hypothetical protein
MQWIAYYRVSTPQQGVSKLGLDAQQDLVMRVLGNTPPIAEFVEVESACLALETSPAAIRRG